MNLFKELTTDARNSLKPGDFVFPAERRYPIHDRAHAANALARASGKPEWSKVKKAVCRRYPDMPACKIEHSEVNAMWIDVFRTGKHTDMKGDTREFTQADLEAMVAKYNEQSEHEAPLVIGHPATDAPAYGWVQRLRVVGDHMQAFVDQVSEKVKDAVRAGMFKKVSIALYQDGLLRHVGLLGANPPAIKGLAPVQFAANSDFKEFSEIDFTFVEGEMKSMFAEFMDMIRGLVTKQAKPNQEEDMDLKELESKFNVLEGQFKEQGLKYIALETQFGEVQKENAALKTQISDMEKKHTADLAAIRTDGIVGEFRAFADGLAKEGKILPAEIDSLVEEYKGLITSESTMQFAEGVKRPSELMKTRLAARTAMFKVDKRHFATKKAASETVPAEAGEGFQSFGEFEDAGMLIETQAREYMKGHPDVTYEQAVAYVASH